MRCAVQKLRIYREAVRRALHKGFSMRLRLIGFLLLFLNFIMLGVIIMLLSTGVFQTGLKEQQALLKNELAHIHQAVYKDFGEIAVQGVKLAERIVLNLERFLDRQGISAHELQTQPQLLEPLLSQEVPTLTGALERTKSSGVFLILDATVNPSLPGAAYSRACVYLKNMEPNIVSGLEANLRYLIGPMAVARSHRIHTLPQWKMEMDIRDAPYFERVVQTARIQERPISRLYYWSPVTVLPGSSEQVMLCLLPLVTSDGEILGACGFEVSNMLFKLAHAPDGDAYGQQLFCLLGPMEGEGLQAAKALFGGSFALRPQGIAQGALAIEVDDRAFTLYRQAGGGTYAGLHQEVALYPEDSAYRDERWALALMMPRAAMDERVSARPRAVMLWLVLLMGIDALLSVFVSRRYIRPVVVALETLKQADLSSAQKSKIPEIDDLLVFLQTQDEQETAPSLTQTKQEQSDLCRAFLENIGKLSAAERSVFDLYMRGHTAKEIADILCLSINTIKTHNRRIYAKLNVTSRKELMLYIRMTQEAGREEQARAYDQ